MDADVIVVGAGHLHPGGPRLGQPHGGSRPRDAGLTSQHLVQPVVLLWNIERVTFLERPSPTGCSSRHPAP
ncbi:MAG: hypothetical protein ABI438_08125, partial [Dermatophilaceae bacterium]